jgi:hypothetical protein
MNIIELDNQTGETNMKTKAQNLLPQTVVKSPDGKIGTLLKFGISHIDGFSGWSVKFDNEKFAKFIPCAEIQKYEIA